MTLRLKLQYFYKEKLYTNFSQGTFAKHAIYRAMKVGALKSYVLEL